MNYSTTMKYALAAATIAALCLGLSMFLYLTSIHVVGWVAISLSVAVPLIFWIVWHIVLSAADTVRHTKGIVTLIVLGLILFGSALPITGRGFATLIGGNAALRAQHAAALPEFEAALSAAYSRVQAQEGVVAALLQADASSRALAAQEGASGQGPRYRDLTSAAAMYSNAADGMRDVLSAGDVAYDAGSDALSQARAVMGTEGEFDMALSNVQRSIRDLNAIDITKAAQQVGTVTTTSDGAVAKLDDVTAKLHRQAAALEQDPVEVPVFDMMSATEAVGDIGENLAYWATAAFIDGVPFLLLVLLLMTWTEAGMRSAPNPRREATAEEQRHERENVVGINRKAAE